MVMSEIRKLWTDRPEPPVYLAWATAGGMVVAVTVVIVWGLLHLLSALL